MVALEWLLCSVLRRSQHCHHQQSVCTAVPPLSWSHHHQAVPGGAADYGLLPPQPSVLSDKRLLQSTE